MRNAFQSYQGSIFTLGKAGKEEKITAFNPIKVLFLRSLTVLFSICYLSFNPIKVLFLRKRSRSYPIHFFFFQSYQGSIFTVIPVVE